jgi:NADH-quinone oxidoreductase subunit M
MSASILSAVFASEGAATFPILPALIFVPLIGAVLIALMPKSRPELSRQMAIITGLLTGVLSIALLVEFKTGDAGFQFVVQQTWVQSSCRWPLRTSRR